MKKLRPIPAFHLTHARLEQLHTENFPLIEQITQRTQQGFQKIFYELAEKKYPKARTYVQNRIQPVATFLSCWLMKGRVIPLNTKCHREPLQPGL